MCLYEEVINRTLALGLIIGTGALTVKSFANEKNSRYSIIC